MRCNFSIHSNHFSHLQKVNKDIHELSDLPQHPSPTTPTPENKQTHIPSKHFEADMNSSTTLDPTKNGSIDMHIGLTFDPEKYLDLEERLVEVEPRPIRHPEEASRNVPQKKSMVAGFVAVATKVVHKLEFLLCAPFQKFSPNYHANAKSEKSSNADRKASNAPEKVEQTSPVAHEVEQHSERRNTSDEWCESGENNIVFSRFEGAKSHRKHAMVRKGYVRRMVQRYEYYSNITTGTYEKSPANGVMALETSASATSLHADAKKPIAEGSHWQVEQRSLLPGKMGKMGIFCAMEVPKQNGSVSSTNEDSAPDNKKKAIKQVSFHEEVEVIGEWSRCSTRSPGVYCIRWGRRKTLWKKVFRVRRGIRIRTERSQKGSKNYLPCYFYVDS